MEFYDVVEGRVVAITPIGEIAQSKDHYDKKDIKEFVFSNTWDNAYSDNIK